MTKVADNIELIMNRFLSTQHLYETIGLEQTLINLKQETDFKSIAYEAISVSIVDAIFTSKKTWKDWQDFFEENKNLYASQLLTGLGWGIAKNGKNLSDIDYKLEANQKSSVLDGFGYYFGLFRSRLTIKNQQISDGLEKMDIQYFDKGLGRSLCYLSKGNSAKISELIAPFDDNRKPNIWQGIGFATAFIGGMDLIDFQSLFNLANEFQANFKLGVLKANYSCSESQSTTEDMKNYISNLFHISVEEAYEKVVTSSYSQII